MSRRLAVLEQRLGVRLIERSSRRFALTEEGAFLHQRALRILTEIDEIEEELGAKASTPSGKLRIGAPMEIGRRRIAQLIGDFQRQYPKITCELVLSDAGLEVNRDELDFSFRTTPTEELDVVAMKVLKSHRVVCCSPEYLARKGEPRTPQELRDHDCLCLVRGRGVFDRWQFKKKNRPLEVGVHGTLTSNNGEVIHTWALEGRGLAFKVGWDIEHDLAEGRLVECLAAFAFQPMYLYGVYPARKRQTARLRVFLDHVRATMGASSKFIPE